MAPFLCAVCGTARAQVLRPKNHAKLCAPCFIQVFEDEVHATIIGAQLFPQRGGRVAIGSSGGKDSTVLAAGLDTLNRRHGYGLELVLLSVDEGIRGYRDDALATVRRNAAALGLELRIVGYEQLYGGWTMDRVVARVGKRGNCTYCGVFRRQALDRGALALGVAHVVTGHNADDVAETVMMNLLRGDLPRLSRGTAIVTSAADATGAGAALGEHNPYALIKRSKPLKFAYEKEIVLYAHHRKLDYFSTECIYSPEAFRGTARALIKDLERIRPSAILDIVKSGEDMARLCPGAESVGRNCAGACGQQSKPVAPSDGPSMENGLHHTTEAVDSDNEQDETGCGTSKGANEMAQVNQYLAQKEHRLVENDDQLSVATTIPPPRSRVGKARLQPTKQKLGQCTVCGYLSSQQICKACLLLEGLNKDAPKWKVEMETGVNK